MSSSQNTSVPIFDYTSGSSGEKIEYENLPTGFTSKWSSTSGGGKVEGPVPFGTLRPDGEKAHGGVLVEQDGKPVVIYHRTER
mmetsp:Transcript_26207/g.66917  ORF Transcript_26207/g.66917 Transcript_26207/m.66917 type:complete len:83 (-) Transcript_26207:61-309(-)|eukprot:CAMPEP_0183447352 /NCGR_PEP_ID=MMETSP0370-20130417/102066_1 /TAXON_ID=268820 /ORGANISM="Peridinium aciculiferum, Strain PAER-2" /LENGTH=82 /DNA_ID=CAMNT_0025638189 /DNA_START=38 /DNA_END=282 /DNA_ORIENTATION=+